MKIIIFVDYSSFTEHLLSSVKGIIGSFKAPEITVVHVIDERLFYATTGYEVQLDEEINDESSKLHELCHQYLGENIHYVEDFGIPKQKIDECLEDQQYDIAIAGTHSRHNLGDRILGSIAEHLLKHSKKPVLIIP